MSYWKSMSKVRFRLKRNSAMPSISSSSLHRWTFCALDSTVAGSDSQEEIVRRLQKVKEEVWCFREYYYIVRNDDLSQSLRELQSIFVAERLKTKRMDMHWLEQSFILEKDAKLGVREPSSTLSQREQDRL